MFPGTPQQDWREVPSSKDANSLERTPCFVPSAHFPVQGMRRSTLPGLGSELKLQPTSELMDLPCDKAKLLEASPSVGPKRSANLLGSTGLSRISGYLRDPDEANRFGPTPTCRKGAVREVMVELDRYQPFTHDPAQRTARLFLIPYRFHGLAWFDGLA